MNRLISRCLLIAGLLLGAGAQAGALEDDLGHVRDALARHADSYAQTLHEFDQKHASVLHQPYWLAERMRVGAQFFSQGDQVLGGLPLQDSEVQFQIGELRKVLRRTGDLADELAQAMLDGDQERGDKLATDLENEHYRLENRFEALRLLASMSGVEL